MTTQDELWRIGYQKRGQQQYVPPIAYDPIPGSIRTCLAKNETPSTIENKPSDDDLDEDIYPTERCYR